MVMPLVEILRVQRVSKILMTLLHVFLYKYYIYAHIFLFIEWTCCKDVTMPCLANISTPFNAASFQYDEALQSMVGVDCNSPKSANRCCEVVPWPEGIGHGYPFRLRREEDKGATSFSSHMLEP
jgi:hypothetical protein